MPDITCCTGEGCPLKDSCWRYTAPKNDYWQSYFDSPPWDEETYDCKYYWPLDPPKKNGTKVPKG